MEVEMRMLLAAAMVAALSACGTPNTEGESLVGSAGYMTTANQVTLADGQPAWLISCQGWANNIGACMTRAHSICGQSSVRLIEQIDKTVTIRCA